MRLGVLVLAAACGKPAPTPKDQPTPTIPKLPTESATALDAGAAAAALPTQTYDDLGAALLATIPADARVVGFGELHSRTDRAQVKSTLAHFTTEALPVLKDKLSDLVIETWLIDKGCQKQATEASAKMQSTMKRPVETKSEIAVLADTARADGIQPHAMRVTCDDYTRIAPPGKEVDPVEMLTLTTKELARITAEAVVHRDKEPGHRPWIGLYGGALHNDRFPDAAVAEWSYAPKADAASQQHFVEIDLIVPELAEGDPALAKQPWFPVVTAAAAKYQVWKRGDRSFVIVLPRTPPGAAP